MQRRKFLKNTFKVAPLVIVPASAIGAVVNEMYKDENVCDVRLGLQTTSFTDPVTGEIDHYTTCYNDHQQYNMSFINRFEEIRKFTDPETNEVFNVYVFYDKDTLAYGLRMVHEDFESAIKSVDVDKSEWVSIRTHHKFSYPNKLDEVLKGRDV